MAEPKKTILMGEGVSESKEKKPWSYYLRTRKRGVGGTIGEIERGDQPDIQVKWKAGFLKGTPGNKRKDRLNKLSRKVRPGFQIEVKF